MIIRTAEPKDAADLLDIYNYEVLHGTSTFDTAARTMEERMAWFDGHDGEKHPLIVAEEHGRVVGYAGLSPFNGKDGYASTAELAVYVDARYRRRHIASRLMKELLDRVRARGEIHAVISMITAGNRASLELHEDFGFTYCGTLKEVGAKFGQMLDVTYYELVLPEAGIG